MARVKTETFDYLLNTNLDLQKRRVFLYGDIDTKSVLKTIKSMSLLARLEDTPITLVMNCEGGMTIDAFALYDYINSLSHTVNIFVLGRCCSAAVLVLQAADHRSAAPNAVFMVHRGTRQDQFDKALDERADDIIAGRMGWTRRKLDNLQDYDNYFFAENALEYKLIDEVVGE
jgi:ATP-dependent Clp protease, protease subunit